MTLSAIHRQIIIKIYTKKSPIPDLKETYFHINNIYIKIECPIFVE